MAGPELDHEATTVTAIVEELTELYLARLDPLTRQALDAASVVRRPTLSLLAAMLPDAAPQDAFERLRGLPFVELSSDGLVLHDTVREVVAAYLRASDPDRSRRYRIAAWRLLRDEVTRATSHEMWRYTADLLYILENPAVREGVLPDVGAPLLRRAGRRRRLAGDPRRSRGVPSRPSPWRSSRTGGAACRTRSGRPATAPEGRRVRRGDPDRPRSRARCSTPIRSPGSGATTFGARRCRAGSGSCASAVPVRHPDDPDAALVVAALILDIKRMYMELRPELRRDLQRASRSSTGPRRRGRRWASGRLLDAPVMFGGVAYYAHSRLRPGVGRRLADADHRDRAPGRGGLDPRRRPAPARPRRRRVALTKLEFEVFKYLYERPGAVVERASLLRDVWGYDYAGGSNVIEALVKSLRRKLGDRSAAIETVRGLGYRFSAAGSRARGASGRHRLDSASASPDALRAERWPPYRLSDPRRWAARLGACRPVVQQRRCGLGLSSARRPDDPARLLQPADHLDKPGTGLSDPVALDALPTIEGWADVLRDVLDVVGSRARPHVRAGLVVRHPRVRGDAPAGHRRWCWSTRTHASPDRPTTRSACRLTGSQRTSSDCASRGASTAAR